MDFFVGLDVSVRTTSICIMDASGAIIREGKAESSPEAIAAFLAAVDRR
ncbi:IS110 family transposase [Mesorhizobium soli]